MRGKLTGSRARRGGAGLGFAACLVAAWILAPVSSEPGPRRADARSARRGLPCEITVDDRGEIRDFASGWITRWYGKPHPARVRIVLSAAELDTLCGILSRGNYFGLPDVLGGGHAGSATQETIQITLRMGGRTKELFWTPDWDPTVRPGKAGPDPRQDFLFEFSQRSGAMLWRRAAYRALPRGPARP